MNRRRITLGASAVSGVAVLGLAALQMSGGAAEPRSVRIDAAPVAALHAAEATTANARTAQVDTIVTMTSPAVPAKGATPAVAAKATTMHGTGLFDFTRQVGKVDLSMATGALEEVLTPAALYLRTAPPAAGSRASAAPETAKNWSKVDITRLSDGNLVSGGATDPGMDLVMLGGVQPDVKLVGQEKVRDVPVAHYHGTLDLVAAANTVTVAAPPPAKPGAPADPAAGTAAADAAAAKKALTNAAHAFLTPKVPFDAYLDADGRLRRFVATFTFVVPGPNKVAAEVVSSTDLYGFGIPVAVATPSAPASPSPSRSAHK